MIFDGLLEPVGNRFTFTKEYLPCKVSLCLVGGK